MQEMSDVEIPTDNDGETDYVDDLMNMNGGKESLTMYGFTSIESRLEAKRAEQEKKEKDRKKKNWLMSRVSKVLSSWWFPVCNKHLNNVCLSNCSMSIVTKKSQSTFLSLYLSSILSIPTSPPHVHS